MEGNAEGFYDVQMDGDRDANIDVSGSSPDFDDFDSAAEAREDYIEAKSEASNARKADKAPEAQVSPESEAKVEAKVEEPVSEGTEEQVAEEIRKMVKGTNLSGDPFDLPQDLTVPVKIDGELTDVNVQDIINDYSGKESWSRKFSQLDLERKEYEADKEQTIDIIQGFSERANSGEIVEAMKYLVDMTGADSHNFHVELRNALMPEIEEYLYMTDEERTSHDTAIEAQYLRQRLETQEEQQKYTATQWETEREATRLREEIGVTSEEYSEAQGFLREQGLESTPEVIGQYYQNLAALNKSDVLLSQVDESLADNDGLKTEVAQLVMSGEFTESEILVQLKELYTQRGASAVNQKIAEANPSRVENTRSDEPLRSFESFDDYEEDEYY